MEAAMIVRAPSAPPQMVTATVSTKTLLPSTDFKGMGRGKTYLGRQPVVAALPSW